MAQKKTINPKEITLGQYQHKEKRVNNPPVGLVSSDLDTKPSKKIYQHDPYIEPTLVWSGKHEDMEFDVDTVSLHIHERIDPKRIISQVLKPVESQAYQPSLFEQVSENFITEKEFDFYSHTKNWSNRLIAGDSLLVMNSLIEKEKMAGQVNMIYMDPPYGIKYNSNFQPYTNKRDVKDNDDSSIPAEPEMIKAFRDTWELGIHSYLTYIRNRLLLARELLHESGSCFVQISDDNLHHLREVMDEIFGAQNFISTIVYVKTSGLQAKLIKSTSDYILWYAKDISKVKSKKLFATKIAGDEGASKYTNIELSDGTRRVATEEERINPKLHDKGARLFAYADTTSQGNPIQEFMYKGRVFKGGWKTTLAGMQKLADQNRLHASKTTLNYIRYIDDFPVYELTNLWSDVAGIMSRSDPKIYVVQTSTKAVERCMLMTTDPGDIVLDPTCGSGTTAYVSEQWGRRWVTCDTSRVAIQLAKQRLMTAKFDYYELAQPNEGLSSGLKYKTVPHVTLGSIANSEPAKEETLLDQPLVIKNKVRVTGPFTVEAVPGVRSKPISGDLPDISSNQNPTNVAFEKLNDYLNTIRSTGIMSYQNEGIIFSSVELAEAYSEIHAFGSIDNGTGYKKCAIIFGPEYAPMEQTQVERTMNEIREMSEKPDMVVFCSYAFDPEASKDIDNIKIDGLQILKAQMNTDLLTKDLKKKADTNRPFWLIGEPDIEITELPNKKFQVEVKGFDYYDPRTQELKSGSTDKIAVWMLDTDYDNRSLFPSQIYFPMGDEKRDWTKLAKALNGNVDEDLLEQYTGTISIPFSKGEKSTIAVKIVDDRGVEMLIVKKI